jgi:hypothetical protein
MGSGTETNDNYATAMGLGTKANGAASTAMGWETTAAGTAGTALGNHTTATGDYSIAMGRYAHTNGQVGSFVYGDASTTVEVAALAPNSFTVRAAGGYIFHSNSTHNAGVRLLPGGSSWTTSSDRNLKENFRAEDGEHLLRAIADLPIPSWNYKTQDPSIRHLGPMAQDFYSAFRLGADDKHINTLDIDGVNLLAVQALENRTRSSTAKLAVLAAENAQLKARISALEATLRRLEAVTAPAHQ